MRNIAKLLWGLIFICYGPAIHAQYSHRLIVKAGDLAPMPLPPRELTDDFWENFPTIVFNDQQTFAEFDEENHFINDAGFIVFRARLSGGLWGYWITDGNEIFPFFLEGLPFPYDLEVNTSFVNSDGDLFLYQNPRDNETLPRFYNLELLEPAKQFLPQSSTDRSDLLSIQFHEFYENGVIANTTSMTADGPQQEIRLHSIHADNEIRLAYEGEVIPYNGRNYRTTRLLDTAAGISHVAWLAEAFWKDPSSDEVHQTFMIRRSSWWLDTFFSSDYIAIGTMSAGSDGSIAFKGKVDHPRDPWGIHAIDAATGTRRLIAEEGSASDQAKAKRFDMIRFFQISGFGNVTLLARDAESKWGIWSEFKPSGSNRELRPLATEGMTSPHDSNLIIDQILRATANDEGQVCFVSTQDDQTGRFAGTTYWLAYFDPETGEPVHEPIITEWEPELTLPTGEIVRGTDIDSLNANLRHNSPHGRAQSFNLHRQVSFRIEYSDPVNFNAVDSLWVSSPTSFVVNHPGDEPDANPGDGIANIHLKNEEGEPVVTLRAAMMESNANRGRHRIEFRFEPEDAVDGVVTIKPQTPLPEMNVSIDLDATTQKGPDEATPGVILDGSTLKGTGNGLVFRAQDNSIQGITVRNFPEHGVIAQKGRLRLKDVDIEHNGGIGVDAHTLNISASTKRQSVLIRGNGKQGIRVQGPLDADACHIQNNGAEGILSHGEQVIINKSDRNKIHISENGSAGIEAKLARTINGGRLIISGNGNQNPQGGAGINAPNAGITLFNSEISKNSSEGLVGDTVELFGGQTVIDANGSHGISITGNLNTEVVRVSNNGGWGVISLGEQILMNEEDDGTCRIHDNALGGISFTGSDLLMVKTNIDRNGAKFNFLAAEGYGIYAPQAQAILDDVKITENEWTGIHTKNLTLWGNLGELKGNGNNGASVTGDFLAEEKCMITENLGWGIEIGGTSCRIGETLNPKTSLIKDNGLGGIRFFGTKLEGVSLEIQNNGSPEKPGIGLDARNANLSLDGITIMGHQSHGLIANNLTLGNQPAIFNQNGDSGAWMKETLTAPNGLIASKNEGWGLIIEGATTEIGLNPTPNKSQIEANGFGGIQFKGTTFRAWELDILGNGSPDAPGSGLEAKDAHVFLGRISSRENQGHGIWANDLTLLDGLSELSSNKKNGAMIQGKFTASDQCIVSENTEWGMAIDGDTAQFGEHTKGIRSEIKKNGIGGIRFGGTDFKAWSMELTENGASNILGAGIGLQASRAVAQLEDMVISKNLGMGMHAKSVRMKDAEINQQTQDGMLICPGPALLESVRLIGNQGSGLIVCDAIGGGDSVLNILEVRNNHIDGIRNENLAMMNITESFFNGNGRFGVNNIAPRINVRAIGNNWGHPTGPSGVGPGQGDPVSKNVVFEEPVDTSPLEIILTDSPVLLKPGTMETIPISIRHGERQETITLRATDTRGWLQFDASGLRTLELTEGQVETNLEILPPTDATSEEISEVMLNVTVATGALIGKTRQATLLVQIDAEPEPPNQPEILPDPQSGVTNYRGEHDKVLYFEVTGNIAGSIWGTSIYTDDSFIGTAAVHAGILNAEETGIVKVTILPGQASYESTTQNGVISQSYGAWVGSYRIEASDLNQNIELPSIQLERQAGQLTLTWTSEDDDIVLESTTNLNSTLNWEAVSNIERDGNTNRLQIIPNQGIRFYRLRR